MSSDTAIKNAIDLTPFCDPDTSSRYALDQPWVVDGWRYATDGKVLVRVPATGEPDTPPHPEGKRRPGKVHEIVPPVDGKWLPWPEIASCEKCEGSLKIECESCCGDGQCENCKCGQCHNCGKCDGIGKVDCDLCDTNSSFKPHFGDAILALKYAYLISNLPNVVYLPAKHEAAIRFKFDGGEGAAMSMRLG